jgi:hypothetical protein
MIKVQTSSEVRTSADIRSFRSLKHPVGPALQSLDRGRIMQGHAKRSARMDHRVWFRTMAG